MAAGPALEVWKFGGASLADATAVRRAAALIVAAPGPLVVVASALAGVTDLLLAGAARPAVEGDRAAAAFLRRHRDVVRALLAPGRERRALLAQVDAFAREYKALCAAVAVLGHLDARTSDLLVARGERLAAGLLSAAIARGGRASLVVDGAEVVSTDDRHGGAAPHLDATSRLARRRLRPELARAVLPVVPGFIGRAPDGSITTLGRGGSDLTATLLGRALGASRVVLWKDVAGILTADPRLVADARLIPQMHHQEAAEVAYYGAKVLHPRALIPLVDSRIVLQVRSFLNPDDAGTEISARRSEPGYPVKALATVRDQAVITVSGKGMAGVHGIAARTFAAVDAQQLSVSTIFQASSESSIGFTLPESQADRAVTALRAAFTHELDNGLVDEVAARVGMAVVAVVGDGMAGTPGIAARVFSALAAGNLNVVAIAQGSSERNISFVVATADAPEAARRIHDAFQLAKIGGGGPMRPRHVDVVLLGFGRVGRALAEQVGATADARAVRIAGIIDRSGYIFEPGGLSRRRIRDLVRGKETAASMRALGGEPATAAGALAAMAGHAVSRPVLVDVTSDETGGLLQDALTLGFDLVMANKKPLAGSRASYDALLAAAGGERRIRYEATVGAGLPIIDTYHKLVETGDRVMRIEGCVSGTLMFLLSEVSNGRRFSEAVLDAVSRGYAEPDPRDDLSGRDAARKGLILARLMGFRGTPTEPENLIPATLRRLPLDRFLERLPALDADWAERASRAADRGEQLRYVVTASARGISASLAAVPATSEIGTLRGTRNLIAFTTTRYRQEPLIISGPGAGPAVTAAGILNDILSVSGR
jgi:aspartokinase/homoserine dehydrogenase 1